MEKKRNFPTVTQVINCRPEKGSCRSMGLAWVAQARPPPFCLRSVQTMILRLRHYYINCLDKDNYSTTINILNTQFCASCFPSIILSFSLSLVLTKCLAILWPHDRWRNRITGFESFVEDHAITKQRSRNLDAGLCKAKIRALSGMWQARRSQSWDPFLTSPVLTLKHSRRKKLNHPPACHCQGCSHQLPGSQLKEPRPHGEMRAFLSPMTVLGRKRRFQRGGGETQLHSLRSIREKWCN